MIRMPGFVMCAALAAASFGARAAADGLSYVDTGKAPVAIDASLLSKLPRSTVQAGAHGAPASAWEGVALVDVLRAEGVPSGESLRGNALARYVRVTAADGYQVVFGLGELDASLGATKVLLVDKHDGKPLDAKDGPFRLVVPGDKRPARWVRSVSTIELLDASSRPAH